MLELEEILMVIYSNFFLLLRQKLRSRAVTHWWRSLGIYCFIVFCFFSGDLSFLFWGYRRENYKFETSQKLFEASGREGGVTRVWSHKWGASVEQSEPFSWAAHEQFPERRSRDVLSILMIIETCGTSSVTALVGSHSPECMYFVFSVSVRAHVQMYV